MTEIRTPPMGPIDELTASEIENDSSVAGATVADALDNVAASGVLSVYARVGHVVAELGDYAASLVTNDSTKAGATVADALEQLVPDPTPEGRILRANGTAWETYEGTAAGQILRWNGTIWIAGTAGVGEIQPFETEPGCVGLWRLNGTLAGIVGPTLVTSVGTVIYADLTPGKPGFYFNGGTRLEAPAFDSSLAITGDMTICSIWQFDTTAVPKVLVGHGITGETAPTNCLYAMAAPNTAPPFGLNWFSESGVGVDASYSTSAPSSLPPIHNVAMISASRIGNVVQFYANGLPFGAPSPVLATPTDGTSGRFRIGADTGSSSVALSVCWGVKILNFGMSAAQHKAQYNSTLGQGFGLLA